MVGLVLAVGAGGSLGALYWARKDLYFFQRTPSPPTLSPDGAAALARVRELEARLTHLLAAGGTEVGTDLIEHGELVLNLDVSVDGSDLEFELRETRVGEIRLEIE